MLQHLGNVHLEYVNSYNNNDGKPPITYLNICHLNYSRPIGQMRFCYNANYSDDDTNMIRMEFDIWDTVLIEQPTLNSKDILESIIALGFIWLCIDNNGIYKNPTMYMTTHNYRENSQMANDVNMLITNILTDLECTTPNGDKYIFPKYCYGNRICKLIKDQNS